MDDANAKEASLPEDDYARFVAANTSPEWCEVEFQRDPSLRRLLDRLFAIGKPIVDRIVGQPDCFWEFAKAVDRAERQTGDAGEERRPTCDAIVGDLARRLGNATDRPHARAIIRQFHTRHLIEIADAEFNGGLSPEQVGRDLSDLADAILECGLAYVMQSLVDHRGQPLRPDGTMPEVTVIGLGNLGGQEMGYASAMKVLFLYDAIDQKNVWHRDFYATLVDDLVRLVCGDRRQADGLDIDLRANPRHEVGVHICGAREAARIYETSGGLWQRLGFVKARVVAGSRTVGQKFLERLEPWVYRSFVSRTEVAEIRTLRHKIERRIEQSLDQRGEPDRRPPDETEQVVAPELNVVRDAGGREDIERAIELLQVVMGGQLHSLRCRNLYDAIRMLGQCGFLGDAEQRKLSEQYARLCRLQHQLTLSLDRRGGSVPSCQIERGRLAGHLGIVGADGCTGDAERFGTLLEKTFAANRELITAMMVRSADEDPETPIESELVLDPDPDPDMVAQTLGRHGLVDFDTAMKNLDSLASETVRYLSPDRCRHVFSSIAPALLSEVSRTPDPDASLASLVQVADSLGAKATLWELLGSHRPTMQLMVRLCATTPYLSGILTDNPGMIDELIDSLVINHLPSADRLDAHSIELCRGSAEIDEILRSFKSSAHLMIGVHDILGKETLEVTHRAIGDTAEACLRRMIDHEQALVADQFGDPVDDQGNASEMVTIAMGQLGAREPNYHSDLEAVLLYSAQGETRRRVGGRRSTTTNERFFSQVAGQVIDRINDNSTGESLYELRSPMQPLCDQGRPVAMTVDQFLARFRDGTATLEEWLAVCKARAISGSRRLRQQTNTAIADAIAGLAWSPEMATEIHQLRLDSQATALPENLNRGKGGTVDVETVAQMLTLRHAAASPDIITQGTTASIERLCQAGVLGVDRARVLIDGYRTLRRIEASLRMMKARAHHALPDDAESMRNLAFLMDNRDPSEITRNCVAARKEIRRVFNEVFADAGG